MEAIVWDSHCPAAPFPFGARVVCSSWSRLWTIGNRALLDAPLLGLFCSRQCTGEVIVRLYDLARAPRRQSERHQRLPLADGTGMPQLAAARNPADRGLSRPQSRTSTPPASLANAHRTRPAARPVPLSARRRPHHTEADRSPQPTRIRTRDRSLHRPRRPRQQHRNHPPHASSNRQNRTHLSSHHRFDCRNDSERHSARTMSHRDTVNLLGPIAGISQSWRNVRAVKSASGRCHSVLGKSRRHSATVPSFIHWMPCP